MRFSALSWAAAVPLLLSLSCGRAATVGDTAERFDYRGRTYELEGYNTLADASTGLGKARGTLFSAYLKNSSEGQGRATKASSTDPATVWGTLAVEEKAAFVAITTALHCVEVNTGPSRFIDWIAGIDEIHGESRFGGGSFSNSEAYRLYARLTPAGLELVRKEQGTFRNTCNSETYDYGGLGGAHNDYCDLKHRHFDSTAKFEHKPGEYQGIQFNFNQKRSDCADVDVDYSFNCHLDRDNSNVLGSCWGGRHINRLVSEYGAASGLRIIAISAISPQVTP